MDFEEIIRPIQIPEHTLHRKKNHTGIIIIGSFFHMLPGRALTMSQLVTTMIQHIDISLGRLIYNYSKA